MVLGLLEVFGPGTPYDLKRRVDASIGHFWSFPRAQFYVEPERLAARGLVVESRQPEGRRRRVFSITGAGREALRAWIVGGAVEAGEVRDPGLLKLFFAGVTDRRGVVALAREHEAHHARRLAEYAAILPRLEADPGAAFALATLRHGLGYERLSVAYWGELAANPPTAGARRPGVRAKRPPKR